MQKKERKPKKDDNENVDKAYTLFSNLITSHPEIEPTLWFSALVFAIVVGFKNSGLSFEDLKDEVMVAIHHYKDVFDEEKS